MRWPIRSGRAPIGVDVGGRRIKAVQLAGGPGSWRVQAAASLPRLAGGALLERPEVAELRRQLEQAGFHGHSVVLTVPRERLLTGILELPPRRSGAPIEELARRELGRMNRCEPQSFEMACWDLPPPLRAANTTFVMAVGCRHDDANRLLDAFEQEGFDVAALDVHAWAALRACRSLFGEPAGLVGLLDIGWSSCQVALVYRGVVVYERRLARGGLAAIIEPLASALNAEAETVEQLLLAQGLTAARSERRDLRHLAEVAGDYLGAIAEEMRVPLSYVTNQYPDAALEKLVLLGGGAAVAGGRDFLAERLAADVRVGMPSELASCPESTDEEHGPALAVAMGLAQLMEA